MFAANLFFLIISFFNLQIMRDMVHMDIHDIFCTHFTRWCTVRWWQYCCTFLSRLYHLYSFFHHGPYVLSNDIIMWPRNNLDLNVHQLNYLVVCVNTGNLIPLHVVNKYITYVYCVVAILLGHGYSLSVVAILILFIATWISCLRYHTCVQRGI